MVEPQSVLDAAQRTSQGMVHHDCAAVGEGTDGMGKKGGRRPPPLPPVCLVRLPAAMTARVPGAVSRMPGVVQPGRRPGPGIRIADRRSVRRLKGMRLSLKR